MIGSCVVITGGYAVPARDALEAGAALAQAHLAGASASVRVRCSSTRGDREPTPLELAEILDAATVAALEAEA